MASEPQGAADVRRRTPRWRRLGWVQILAVALLVLLAVVYARSPDDGSSAAPPRSVGRVEAPPPLVRIIRPLRSATVLRVEATGSVGVRNYVALTPQIGGRVVAVSPSLRSGGAFAAGEELLTVERRDFQLAQAQARADVDSARANLMLQEAQSDAAKANYALLNPNTQVPPLIARAPQIAQAKAQLGAALARADIAALELRRTVFSLPFAGRVKESTAEVGQVLSRNQPFGQAFALDAVEVAVPVSADDLQRLQGAVGRRATVYAEGRALAAKVQRVSAELDQRSRFATLYLTFDDYAAAPVPGTFSDVLVEGPEIASTYVLPEAAEQVGGSVWLVAGGVLRSFSPRTLGRSEDGWVVAAFDAQDGVVLGAVPGARAELPVQTANAAAPSQELGS